MVVASSKVGSLEPILVSTWFLTVTQLFCCLVYATISPWKLSSDKQASLSVILPHWFWIHFIPWNSFLCVQVPLVVDGGTFGTALYIVDEPSAVVVHIYFNRWHVFWALPLSSRGTDFLKTKWVQSDVIEQWNWHCCSVTVQRILYLYEPEKPHCLWSSLLVVYKSAWAVEKSEQLLPASAMAFALSDSFWSTRALPSACAFAVSE